MKTKPQLRFSIGKRGIKGILIKNVEIIRNAYMFACQIEIRIINEHHDGESSNPIYIDYYVGSEKPKDESLFVFVPGHRNELDFYFDHELQDCWIEFCDLRNRLKRIGDRFVARRSLLKSTRQKA